MKIVHLILISAALLSTEAFAQQWEPVTGAETLRNLISGKRTEGVLSGDQRGVAIYKPDGTAQLQAWGGTFSRNWRIEGDDRICVETTQEGWCVKIERSVSTQGEFRATRLDTGETVVFTITDATLESDAGPATSSGGAAEPTADEIAAKLSNPTAPVMTIGNNIDFVTFDGDLPGASDQDSFRYVFQTVFPFKQANGGVIFFRPAIPVLFNEPIPDGLGGWESSGTEIGDIGYDFSYGKTTDSGFLWGAGIAGTIPSATDDRLGKDLWAVGPELLLGKIGTWGVVGGLIAHQWDVAGSGEGEIDLTTVSYFYAFPLGGGWQFAAGPVASYDHTRESGDRWTIPAGIGLAKTSVIGGRPWKFQLQYWNYVEAPDAFAAEHQIRLSINPVINAPWNDDK